MGRFLIQTISLLIFLAGYVKFAKAKNPSIALFIFLCYSLMVPNFIFDVILVHPTVIFILQGVLVILFYVILVRPLSKLTKERIIAVADSYDAMTSNRSYRNYLPQDKVREELLNNIGTQFDEAPAKCMVEIMDEDKEYQLHE
ncbi:MAG: hypothetical protein K5678_09725 [Acetatifactor sp.]|nr:hypothetical protein [Acetatifactor sp.]